ncbi:hypothetical protein PYCC9005_003241 [Savitreella phatthalungensis]
MDFELKDKSSGKDKLLAESFEADHDVDDSLGAESARPTRNGRSRRRGMGCDGRARLFIYLVAALVIVLILGASLAHRQSIQHTTVYPSQAYNLVRTHAGESFFDGFDFFSRNDPTHGFVDYQSKSQASNLISANEIHVEIRPGVTANSRGIPSIRIESTDRYTGGLFLLDIEKMPTGCGAWPAFWLTDGTHWPDHGEIDVIEGVNLQSRNVVSLHTGTNCNTWNIQNRNQTGEALSDMCFSKITNVGCGTRSQNATSFGAAFNKRKGGVYALDWRTNGIRVWFFPRDHLPADLSSSSSAGITMQDWGLPDANFPDTGCDIVKSFRNHAIIFDLTFCGDWAGNQAVWSASPCSSQYSTCIEYMQSQDAATALKDMSWRIRSLKVYQAA